MKNSDVKLLSHHLNDMYKAIGVLQSSLADIKPYLDKELYSILADNLSNFDQGIEGIGSEVDYAYLKRL